MCIRDSHKSVFNSAGLEVREYAYYDAANHTLDFDGMPVSYTHLDVYKRQEEELRGKHRRP